MKAVAVFFKEKKVRLIDHPEPKIEKNSDVKIKILEVGICGTDREICQFLYGAPPKGNDYLILGHESLGRVVEVGSAVTTLKPGDLVVLSVRRPCHHASCISCQQYQQDFCYTGDFKERGINQLHGFMTEYVVDEERYIVKVPETLRDTAILTEPLTISEKARRELNIIQKRLPWGEKFQKNPLQALVIGAGPVGLLAAHVFNRHHFSTLVYSLEDKKEMRAQLAVQLGARYFSIDKVPLQELSQLTQNKMDVIFDASGASNFAFKLFPLLNYNGIFVWTGIPGTREPIKIHSGALMRDIVLKNQIVFGSVNASRVDFESAVANLSSLKKVLESLNAPVIKRFPVESYEELLLEAPATSVLKSVLQFN